VKVIGLFNLEASLIFPNCRIWLEENLFERIFKDSREKNTQPGYIQEIGLFQSTIRSLNGDNKNDLINILFPLTINEPFSIIFPKLSYKFFTSKEP
jgi:hypothetical protein